MSDWIKFVIGAAIPLLFNIYQFFSPRSLSRLKYRIVDETRPAEPGLVEMRGKRFEIWSSGNKAAQSVLVHIVMRHQLEKDFIYIDTSVKVDSPYSSRSEEINVPIPSLNPREKVIIRVYSVASECTPGEDVLLEHRITHSERAAKRVRRWFRKF